MGGAGASIDGDAPKVVGGKAKGDDKTATKGAAKPEGATEAKVGRTAEAKVQEHKVYFGKLRSYFSDPVAIALTNAHHYGGFGAVIGDMAEQRMLGAALSDGKRDAGGRQATFVNPLEDVSDDEGDD
mgnify:CR=1 FL=1